MSFLDDPDDEESFHEEVTKTLVDTDAAKQLDILDEIDSILNEKDDDDLLAPPPPPPKQVVENGIASTSSKASKNTVPDSGGDPPDKSKTDTSFTFSPLDQSTPVRPSTSKESFPMTSSNLNTIAEEDEDYSLLESDDEDGFRTMPLDMHLKELDMSLLDDEYDEAETSGGSVTVIEVKQEATTDDQNDVTVKEESVVKEEAKVQPVVARPHADDSKQFVITGKESLASVMKAYYAAAMKIWSKTTAPGYSLPYGPFDPRTKLTKPNVTKNSEGKVVFYEKLDEWADRHHPMWDEYRQKTRDDSQIGAFIHHKWNWKSSIDITRNLTKFSAPRRNAKNNQGVAVQVKKRGKKAAAPKVEAAPGVIESKDILKTLLKSVKDNEGALKVEDFDEVDDDNDNNDNDNGNDVANHNLAGCKFCTFVCHCSPGRRRKRPYMNAARNEAVVDLGVSEEKLLRIDEVHSEVRKALNTQMQSEADSQREIGYYRNSALNVISSTNEAFELAVNYRASETDTPCFSRDQVRELLSVEITQDKYRSIYMSPYAGHGQSDVEDDSDDDHNDELGGIDDDPEEEWSTAQVENY